MGRKSSTASKPKAFASRTLVWVGNSNAGDYQLATVVVDKREGHVDVRLMENQKICLVKRDAVHLVDTRVIDSNGESTELPKNMHDMVTLTPPNVGNILHLLKERSTTYDSPYTFVGPVLISVNPLRKTEDQAKRGPHPHRIAEAALKQMKFAKITNQPLDQSIIVSGESGAGKTEASKRVLSRLVSRAVHDDDGKSKKKGRSLDKRLIDTNPILEAFGNATTLRNRNSSRFGKFMKLHVNKKSDIVGASVETYLLERSRVSGFVNGECNYHVFYILLGGADKSLLKSLGLSSRAKEYQYLVPLMQDGDRDPDAMSKKARPDQHDKDEFPVLQDALSTIGIGEEEQMAIYKVLASILHLGNVDVDGGKDFAEIDHKDKALTVAAEQLGVDPKSLISVLAEKTVKAGGEVMKKKLSGYEASKARDAVSKQMYSHLFDFVVEEINSDLSSKKADVSAFIGVLDIFGFETFQYNDLEQLLINYTNEALHGIFLQKVFDAELSMYVQEGLVPEGDNNITVPENVECLKLLKGTTSPRQLGVLDVIVDAGNQPNANDKAMNAQLHKTFSKNPEYFPKVHPKDIDHMFKVRHFPGNVSYHIGNFLQKNHDRLPEEVEELFASSSSSKFVKKLWKSTHEANVEAKKAAAPGKKKSSNSSIVSKFKKQIELLSDTLTASQCSFIRCIKPNYFLERPDDDSTEWFDSPYISAQLACLGIEPTVQVLSKGMPNRLSYNELTETYKKLLPKESIKAWKKFGGGDKLFISALFYAFDISPSKYKLGFSYVFFKSGDLEELEKVLEKSSGLKEKEIKKIGESFKAYMVRSKWKKALYASFVVARFSVIAKNLAKKKKKALKKKQEQSIIPIQAVARGFKARRECRKLMDKKMEERQKQLEELEKKAMEEEEEAYKALNEAQAIALNDAHDEGREMALMVVQLLKEQKAANEVMSKTQAQLNDLTVLEEENETFSREMDTAIQRQNEWLEKRVEDVEQKRYQQQEDDLEDGRNMMALALKMRNNQMDESDPEFERLMKPLQRQKEKKEEGLREIRANKDYVENQMEVEKKKVDELNVKIEEAVSKLAEVAGKSNKKLVQKFKIASKAESVLAQTRRELKEKKLMTSRQLGKLSETKERIKQWNDHTADEIGRVMKRQQYINKFRSKESAQQHEHLVASHKQKAFMRKQTTTQFTNIKFWATKCARRSRRNWKRRFFIVRRKDHTLVYRKDQKSKSDKGSYKLSSETTVTEDTTAKRPFALKFSDPYSADLLLAFPKQTDMLNIKIVLEDIISELKSMQEPEVEDEPEDVAPEGRGILSKAFSRNKWKKRAKQQEDDYDIKNNSTIPPKAFEELLDMKNKGELSEEDFRKIIENEEDLVLGDDDDDDTQQYDSEFNIQIICDNCDKVNNSAGGAHCRFCKAKLAVSPVQLL